MNPTSRIISIFALFLYYIIIKYSISIPNSNCHNVQKCIITAILYYIKRKVQLKGFFLFMQHLNVSGQKKISFYYSRNISFTFFFVQHRLFIYINNIIINNTYFLWYSPINQNYSAFFVQMYEGLLRHFRSQHTVIN